MKGGGKDGKSAGGRRRGVGSRNLKVTGTERDESISQNSVIFCSN